MSISFEMRTKSHTRSFRLFSTLYKENCSKDRTLNIFQKDKLESSPINIRSVPSLTEIEELAKSSTNNEKSASYCQLSGGYPDPSVKESVYLNIWACLTHEMLTIDDNISLSNISM